MSGCLYFNLVTALLASTTFPAARGDEPITECHELFCYHLHNSSQFVVHVWNKFNWLKLPELRRFCQESVHPPAFLLEIYGEGEQKFIENFVRRHTAMQRTLVPPVVPLNMNVSFLDDWTWLTGKKLYQSKSLIFGKSLRNMTGSHFAIVKLTNVTFYCDQSPSYFSLHRAICEINLASCAQLSSTLYADGYCFFVVEELMNWHQAREFCRDKDGDLATFEDDRKILFFLLNFVSSISTNIGYWIGLTNIQEVWLEKNEPVVFANWGSIDLSAVNYTNELVNLNLERSHWFHILPITFEMKVICMTERHPIDKAMVIENGKSPTNIAISSETCHSSIWLGAVLGLVLIALGIVALLYALERRKKFVNRSQDQQVIFEKAVENSTDHSYTNFSDSNSNPSI